MNKFLIAKYKNIIITSILIFLQFFIILWQFSVNDNLVLFSTLLTIFFLVFVAGYLIGQKEKFRRVILFICTNLCMFCIVLGVFYKSTSESLLYSVAYYLVPEFRKKIENYSKYINDNKNQLNAIIDSLEGGNLSDNSTLSDSLPNVKSVFINEDNIFFYFTEDHPFFDGIAYSRSRVRKKFTGRFFEQIMIWKRIQANWYYWEGGDPY